MAIDFSTTPDIHIEDKIMVRVKQPKFTLTELIVIIIILAITGTAISFGISKLSHERERARRINCLSDLYNISLAIRMYSQENKEEFPNMSGRSGFEMLRSRGYLETCLMYTCPSTNDRIPEGNDLRSSSVSYLYACGLNESTSVDSGLARDNNTNHSKYGNVLFVDGHASGYAGMNWTSSAGYLGSSIYSY